MNVLLATSNPIHFDRLEQLGTNLSAKIITSKQELIDETTELQYDYIFFFHWSYLIPATIYLKHDCVVFHMTDLPYGRGGSPLQNLIVRGHKETVISAIKVEAGLDTGPLYLKTPLSLLGTAREIFMRAGELMETMTLEILSECITPSLQEGKVTTFKRRKREDGNVGPVERLEGVYDYIRMLDAEGYPSAFLESDHFRFEFSRASLYNDQIVADVRITKK